MGKEDWGFSLRSRVLECSLVLIARMVGLHSYGYLNLKTNCNAVGIGTFRPSVTTVTISEDWVVPHSSRSVKVMRWSAKRQRIKAKMRTGATCGLFAKKA